jgi:hypothetical protein
MNTRTRLILVFASVLLIGVALWTTLTQAAPGVAPLAQNGAPTMVSYQGEVYVSGSPYNGTGYFKFAIVDAAGTSTYWSNDGSSTGGREPTAAVVLDVSDGLFSVLLGDTTIRGMTEPLRPAVFDDTERYLRVWFSSDGGAFEQLTPDTQVAAVPYALQAEEAANADTVDGLHAGQLGADYENVIVVAKSGGDYTTVQAAIDSISDAAADNAYLVWVAPGVYSETVTLMPYVHLQGAGQEATVITSTVSSGSFPPAQATLELAADTSLRDLTVGNTGAGTYNVALLAATGTTRTLVADVTARAPGNGADNHGVMLSGSGTGITLRSVTALVENGSSSNYGLLNYDGTAVLRGGSFTGRGGTYAEGIYNSGRLEAESVTVLGESGSDANYGLYNDGGTATVRSGSFTARGGVNAAGIYNDGSAAVLGAESVTVLGESGLNNYGLYNNYGTATMRSGSCTGRGGSEGVGIYNYGGTAGLEAESVAALGEDGVDTNYGLRNYQGIATLRGGSFTARGGTHTRSIYNSGSTAGLEAESVTVLGENGSSQNYGLFNSSTATVRYSSFTGRGGGYATGISSGTTLEAESVTALGENGSLNNCGLDNDGPATLHGGSFTAHGGFSTDGIVNSGTLEAESVAALGENGSDTNHGLHIVTGTTTIDSSQFTGDDGLYQLDGTVYLGVSQLDGGATRSGGTLTCHLVYDGDYNSYNCP